MKFFNDYIYHKILKDVKRHLSDSNKVRYINEAGLETETVFDIPPTPEELEGLLLFLNKDKIAQA
jgi:hypothetical protein|tara:strand:+ start:303 stop:497 length:195 start_codon:yes stop_codon:yes gene_type:complete